ncbi:MAG: methionine ABC transporter substrate-binding protein, partial [Erysipelotrichia bacterium]|nr:methionine ABC transporter substrate-binding protein [Erysipelotrichia bacterium]
MNSIIRKFAVGAVALTLTACASSTSAASTAAASSTSSAAGEPEVLTVIATANPHAEILEQAKPILLEKYNISLEITVTDDYYTPNEAVSNGDADANYFQHVPFFNNEKETNGYKISNVGGIHIEPFGFYSKTVDDIKNLADNATIVISNSVADNGRILAILQKAGLITIKEGVETISATLND